MKNIIILGIALTTAFATHARNEVFCVEYRVQEGYVPQSKDTPESALGNKIRGTSPAYSIYNLNIGNSVQFVLRMSQVKENFEQGVLFPRLASGSNKIATVFDATLVNKDRVLQVKKVGRREYIAKFVNRSNCQSVIGAFSNDYYYQPTDTPRILTKFKTNRANPIAERTYRVFKNPQPEPTGQPPEGVVWSYSTFLVEPVNSIRNLR